MSTSKKPIDPVAIAELRAAWREMVDDVEAHNEDLPRDEVLFLAALLMMDRKNGR